eukprot:4201373-Pyramimonas_sp.AAC.1
MPIADDGHVDGRGPNAAIRPTGPRVTLKLARANEGVQRRSVLGRRGVPGSPAAGVGGGEAELAKEAVGLVQVHHRAVPGAGRPT